MNNSKPDYNWTVYDAEATGLGKKGEIFNKILIEDSVFYLLGSSPGNDLSKSKSVVYKSDNYGRDWIEEYTDKGNITNGYLASNELNLLKEIYTDNSLDNTSLSLINKDSIIHSFKINSSVKGVFMDSSGKGTLVINNSFFAKDNSVFRTQNNFKSYDSTYVGKPIKKSYFFKDKVYLLTYELIRENYKVREQNELYIINKDENRDSLRIEFNTIDFIVDNEGVLFLGKEEGGITLNNIGKTGEVNTTSIIRSKNLEPKKIYKHKKFIAILSSLINESALGGFGGSEYRLHLSFDNGKTFIEEKLPIDNYVSPITFYKDEKIIIYSGAGRISVCDLKKLD